jgi:hypothetical protein
MDDKEKRAFVKKMKKAKEAKAKERKKTGGKSKKSKSNPKKKNSSRAKLEQRIADLEEKFHQKLKHYQDYDSRELDFDGDQIRQTRIKLSDELKKELESGRNG